MHSRSFLAVRAFSLSVSGFVLSSCMSKIFAEPNLIGVRNFIWKGAASPLAFHVCCHTLLDSATANDTPVTHSFEE